MGRFLWLGTCSSSKRQKGGFHSWDFSILCNTFHTFLCLVANITLQHLKTSRYLKKTNVRSEIVKSAWRGTKWPKQTWSCSRLLISGHPLCENQKDRLQLCETRLCPKLYLILDLYTQQSPSSILVAIKRHKDSTLKKQGSFPCPIHSICLLKMSLLNRSGYGTILRALAILPWRTDLIC